MTRRIHQFHRNAGTRAGVLAVAAALGLLVPLVVAALRDAGEQARIAQCLSNLGLIGRATQVYLTDYNDNLPTVVRSTGGYWGAAGWYYGGQTGHDYWKSTDGGVFWAPVTTRPLNEYVLGGTPQPDIVQGTQIIRRTPMPMFACPSDGWSPQRTWNDTPEWPGISSYEDIGTSYVFNLSVASDTNIEPWDDDGAGWTRIYRTLMKDYRSGGAENLLLYMEAPLDFGLSVRVQTSSYHGRFAWHAAGYLDGHADYQFMDTRGWCGPGWAAINGNWVRLLGQPRPSIYYQTAASKNCDPPSD